MLELIPSELGGDVRRLTHQEKAHKIAERFFTAIDSNGVHELGPQFIAYFMEFDEDHGEIERELVGAMKELCLHGDSRYELVADEEFPEILLSSLETGNQLVVSEQPEAGARSYWVCAPGQNPAF